MIIDRIVTGPVNVPVEFTLLYPGDVARLNPTPSSGPVKAKPTVRLPKGCVHTTTEWFDEGIEVTSCPNLANVEAHSPNGFLCDAHHAELISSRRQRKSGNQNEEVIKDILTTESKALMVGMRESVRLTTKGTFIHYLT